jgi:hypothetical protein
MMRNRASWLPALVLAVVLAWPGSLAAQYTEPPGPAAYALQNVTVVQADGSRMDSVTLVIRGGMIESMGPGVPVPGDAKLLEGDSLYVYPGLIDAQGVEVYEFPEIEIDRSEIRSWDPPRNAQTFMPHRRVVDYLTASGADLADQRTKGVVAAAMVPGDRLMPGSGAVLCTGVRARHERRQAGGHRPGPRRHAQTDGGGRDSVLRGRLRARYPARSGAVRGVRVSSYHRRR